MTTRRAVIAVSTVLMSCFVPLAVTEHCLAKGPEAKEGNYGQANSLQKKEDWEAAVNAYLAAIEDLTLHEPDSNLLPKCYVGCAYCALKLGDVELAFQCMSDLWTTGAWANPNLPASEEYAGYALMLEGRYSEAIDAFAAAIDKHQTATKKRQEAQISLAVCHLVIGGRGHNRLARGLFETVAKEAEDRGLRAFASWCNGVDLLSLMDLAGAEASFRTAWEIDPTFDPSVEMQKLITDQLQPPANAAGALKDTGDDLAQLAEDYVNAWYCTLKAEREAEAGNIHEANRLYSEANLLWNQTFVASTTFPSN